MGKGVSQKLEEFFKGLEQRLRKRYYGWSGAKQFEGTGSRLVRAFDEFCWTNERIQEDLEKHLSTAFIDKYDEMLVEGPVKVWTLCPHHLLPCQFTVYVGYVPNELVLGLSKFARIAVTLGKRPVIQEMYSRELAEAVDGYLKPRGVGVFVVGNHGCMETRGVCQRADVTTSVLKGVIRDNPEARNEFLAIVRERNGR